MSARLLHALARCHCVLSKACPRQRLVHPTGKPLKELESATCSALARSRTLDLFFPDAAAAGGSDESQVLAMNPNASNTSISSASCAAGCQGEPVPLATRKPLGTPRMAHRPHPTGPKWFIKTVERLCSSMSTETPVPKQDLPQIKRPLKASRTRQPSRTNLPALSVNEVKMWWGPPVQE